jgi:hypothetical protein
MSQSPSWPKTKFTISPTRAFTSSGSSGTAGIGRLGSKLRTGA